MNTFIAIILARLGILGGNSTSSHKYESYAHKHFTHNSKEVNDTLEYAREHYMAFLEYKSPKENLQKKMATLNDKDFGDLIVTSAQMNTAGYLMSEHMDPLLLGELNNRENKLGIVSTIVFKLSPEDSMFNSLNDCLNAPPRPKFKPSK